MILDAIIHFKFVQNAAAASDKIFNCIRKGITDNDKANLKATIDIMVENNDLVYNENGGKVVYSFSKENRSDRRRDINEI